MMLYYLNPIAYKQGSDKIVNLYKYPQKSSIPYS